MTELTTTATTTEQKPDLLSRPLLATLNIDWEKAIYITFIVLAIVSRFWGLGGRVMSHDESLHTQFSYQFYRGDGFQHTPLMHGPFLFHITAVSYWLFGDNDLAARIPVAIIGVLLVAMPYLLRPWLGRIGALFTSFFFLISPFITYYSRYIRHDIFVIVWAMIVFIATLYYLRERKEKYLWWFAAGVALMFSTKEVAFIYVAIFGSFLVMRLAVQLGTAQWFSYVLPKLRPALLILLLAVLLIGGGFIGQQASSRQVETVATQEATQGGFAADPDEDVTVTTQPETGGGSTLLRWVQIAGIGLLGLGLFLAVQEMRPRIDAFPEFDLILLFTTLILPMASPFLTQMAGWNPRDYSLSTCMLEGQESMTAVQLFLARLGNSICWSSFLSSGLVRSGFFLLLTLAVAILVGLWWNRRRWLVAAVIFHSIFIVLYTSVFTHPGGWASGMIGSLAYWLEQQGVARGNQPGFYYFFIVPFYEFLPLIFALAAIRLWAKRHQLNKIVGYWLTVILVALLAFSLTNWLFNRPAVEVGAPTTVVPGLVLGFLILAIGVVYWFFVRRQQLLHEYGLRRNFKGLVQMEAMCELVPFLTWWFIITWAAYSAAGEKMPWLSTHFVIPMALLGGWYFAQKLRDIEPQALLSRRSLLLLGVTAVLVVTVFLAVGPLLLGEIRLGNQQLDNLRGIGRFLGGLVAAGILYYFWQQLYERVSPRLRNTVIVLSVFMLLSLLTVRFTYMANFPNADYATEFLVYAHSAPATKNTVLAQIEELSMRLHGDKSLRVAFGGSGVSWPFTWYLREYPNRNYFAENPSANLTESPIIIVGRSQWGEVEKYLGNNYEQYTYTYLWWPMEEYRNISWDAIFGSGDADTRRGLGNPDVRQALWDIFFYRDYEKYGQVFGNTYTDGQWPVRDDLHFYIRKDAITALWDYGIGAVGIEDPYAENELQLSPVTVLNESGVAGAEEGQLSSPRNVAIGPDGRLYVADSGNHRIQVFDQNGQFIRAWGSFGTEPGTFNEPWGLVVDENFVYVADTWNHRIQKFTHEGEFVAMFGRDGSVTGESDESLGLFFGPRDLVLLGEDRLLVTDTGNHRLQLLDREGNFLSQVGGQGNILGQFNEPVGLGVGPDGFIYLADTWNGRVQQFDANLSPVAEWPVDAWSGQSINNKPYLAVDSAGRVYVTDPEGYRVLVFGNDGNYMARFGQYGNDSNSFGLPNGIAIDSQDNLYVADAGNNRILKYAPLFGPAQPANGVGE